MHEFSRRFIVCAKALVGEVRVKRAPRFILMYVFQCVQSVHLGAEWLQKRGRRPHMNEGDCS